jgi:cytosine/uracil/thiamine/allantoin permease
MVGRQSSHLAGWLLPWFGWASWPTVLHIKESMQHGCHWVCPAMPFAATANNTWLLHRVHQVARCAHAMSHDSEPQLSHGLLIASCC